MSPVAVVTDTTHYLPADVVARHEIHQVSLYVNWDGRTDREIDLPDYDAFYDHMRSATDLPSTSQPSVGDFLAVYEPLLEAGEDVLSIHLFRGILGAVAGDTLESLRRGGRIGGAQAWIGSALKIKPILSIDREILPIERVRTAGRAFERMVEHLESLRDGGADIFFIQHIQAHDVAERLASRGAQI